MEYVGEERRSGGVAPFFTPESPLGQQVQQVLLEARDGLTVHEIRRALRL